MIKEILENKEIRNFIIELVTRGGAILIALFVLYIMYADRMSDNEEIRSFVLDSRISILS